MAGSAALFRSHRVCGECVVDIRCVQIRSSSESRFVQANEWIASRHNQPTLHSFHRTFIMNSFKTSTLAKGIAAACLAAGLATPAVAQFLTSNPLGTPDDGLACRNTPNAYIGSQSGGAFFCKRTKIAATVLTCVEPGFLTKVIREGPNGGGKDICAAPGRNYTSNGPLFGTENTDYKFFVVDNAKVATMLANQRRDEAAALGVTESEVDAKSLASEIAINKLGSEDKLQVTVEFATFAKPVGGLIGNQGPVGGLPTTVNSTSAFVPKALPR
jgi:hypothetical protein